MTYDIRDPGRLRKVHKIVVAHGDQLQYSVYVCDLTKVELVKMRAQIRSAMNAAEDSVSIFDLGPPKGKVVERVQHLGVVSQVSEAAPEVW